MTDEETDRMMSLRASSRIPLPPEICLCEPRDAGPYFRWLTFYEVFGLSEHPLVKVLGRRRLDAAMASAVSRAEHLDRVSHYGAWLGNETVSVIDLTAPAAASAGKDAAPSKDGAGGRTKRRSKF